VLQVRPEAMTLGSKVSVGGATQPAARLLGSSLGRPNAKHQPAGPTRIQQYAWTIELRGQWVTMSLLIQHRLETDCRRSRCAGECQRRPTADLCRLPARLSGVPRNRPSAAALPAPVGASRRCPANDRSRWSRTGAFDPSATYGASNSWPRSGRSYVHAAPRRWPRRNGSIQVGGTLGD
jgi:hypothetical protein